MTISSRGAPALSFLDILILVLAALGLVLGWRLRASTYLFLLLALGLGLLAARIYAADLRPSFVTFSPLAAGLLAWLVPFVVTAVGVLLLGALFGATFDWLQLRWLDHASGALLAAATLLILLVLGLSACEPAGRPRPAWIRNSTLAGPLLSCTRPWLAAGRKWLPSLRKRMPAPRVEPDPLP